MTEKSFLEILSEKIENRIRDDIFQAQGPSHKQSNNQTPNEKSTQNVDNSSLDTHSDSQSEALNDSVYNQWMSQIPLGKIHFSTPKQHIFGRVYPVNTPKPKPQALRQKHLLNEKQMQSVVYFWGFQIRLSEDFTLLELKKAFRSLAHRLHPDRNDGKTKAFIELKAHYQCLLSVFHINSK